MSVNKSTAVIKALSLAGVDEDHYQWYGFVIALLVKGFIPGDQALTKMVAEILNGGEVLPGKMIAYLASAGLELKEKLQHQDIKIFDLPDKSAHKQLRLKALADLASGLSLGLGCDPKLGMLKKLPSGELTDYVQTLSEIARVDPEDDLNEDDLTNVLDYMRSSLFNLCKQH